MAIGQDNLIEITAVVDLKEAEASLDRLQGKLNGLGAAGNALDAPLKKIADALAKLDSTAVGNLDKVAQSITDIKSAADPAGQSLEQVATGVEHVGQTAQSSESAFSSFGAAIIVANQGLQLLEGLASFATSAMSQLIDVLERADAVEDAAAGFESLQRSIGQDSVIAINELQSATDGLITKLSLMEITNRAVIAGVEDGSGTFTELAGAAAQLSQAVGVDATTAVNQLTIALQSQSERGLRAIGIAIDSEAAYEKQAAALGKTVDELTKLERQQAFTNATLEAAKTALGRLGDGSETAAGILEKLQVQLSDMAAAFVVGVSDSDALTDSMAALSEQFANGEPLARDLGVAIGDLASIVVNAADVAILAIDGWAGFFATIRQGTEDIAGFLGAYSAIPNDLNKSVFENTFGTFGAAADLKSQLEFEDVLNTTKDLKAEFNSLAKELENVEVKGQALQLGKKLQSIQDELIRVTGGTGIDGILNSQNEVIAKANELSTKLPSALLSVGGSADGAAKKVKSLSETLDELGSKQLPQTLTQDIQSIVSSSLLAGESIESVIEKMKGLGAGLDPAQFSGFTSAIKSSISQFERLQQVVQGIAGKDDNGSFVAQLENLVSQFNVGSIEGDQFQRDINELATSFVSAGGSVEDFSGILTELIGQQQELGAGFRQFGQSLSDFAGVDVSGLFEGDQGQIIQNQLRGGIGALGKELGFKMNAGIADAVLSGGATLLTALDDGINRDDVAAIGSSIGGVLGAAIGGPMGAAIGQVIGQLGGDILSDFGKNTSSSVSSGLKLLAPSTGFLFGDAIGDAIDNAFGGKKDPGANAREGFKEYLNALVESAGLNISDVFNGGSFEILGGRDAFDPFVDAFGNQTTRIQEALEDIEIDPALLDQFTGIGTALADISGLAEESGIAVGDLGSQFGQLLALNIPLDQLQVLLQQAGFNAETLGQALETSYEKGNLQAGQFLNALAATQDLMEQGIPGATGAVLQAFENYGATALRSGADARNSLGDIGAEAEDLKLQFSEIDDYLIANGANAEDVAKKFEALIAAGIDTTEELKNISLVDTARVTANAQAAGAAFTAVADDINEANQRLLDFRANAEKKVVTEWEIRTKVTGDAPPSGLSGATDSLSGQTTA